jgi:hypothetical protein
MVCKEGDDSHLAAALGTEERIDFINLADHLSLAPGSDGSELILNNPERESRQARLLDLPPMSIGVEAVITDGDLALVRDGSRRSG